MIKWFLALDANHVLALCISSTLVMIASYIVNQITRDRLPKKWSAIIFYLSTIITLLIASRTLWVIAGT